MTKQIEEYVKERNEAMLRMDIAWARKHFPGSEYVGDEVLLAAMHKTRYNIPSLPPEARIESAEWLRSRGYSDLHGIPLLPPGELPI